jgi:hypothetical protein
MAGGQRDLVLLRLRRVGLRPFPAELRSQVAIACGMIRRRCAVCDLLLLRVERRVRCAQAFLRDRRLLLRRVALLCNRLRMVGISIERSCASDWPSCEIIWFCWASCWSVRLRVVCCAPRDVRFLPQTIFRIGETFWSETALLGNGFVMRSS